MPCNCDGFEPSEKARESQLVCQHLVYVLESLGRPVQEGLRKDSENMYGNKDHLDDQTRWLCDLVRHFTNEQLNRIVYDGRNPKARKLATWWDDHQERDKKRIEKETEEHKRELLKHAAFGKLTKEEREALGL